MPAVSYGGPNNDKRRRCVTCRENDGEKGKVKRINQSTKGKDILGRARRGAAVHRCTPIETVLKGDIYMSLSAVKTSDVLASEKISGDVKGKRT